MQVGWGWRHVTLQADSEVACMWTANTAVAWKLHSAPAEAQPGEKVCCLLHFLQCFSPLCVVGQAAVSLAWPRIISPPRPTLISLTCLASLPCAGWDLLQALLRPRRILVGDDNSVSFVSGRGVPLRISAQEALRHPFLEPAAEWVKQKQAEERAAAAAAKKAAAAAATSSREGAGSGGRRRGGSVTSVEESMEEAAGTASTSGSGSSKAGSSRGSGWTSPWPFGRTGEKTAAVPAASTPGSVEKAAAPSGSGSSRPRGSRQQPQQQQRDRDREQVPAMAAATASTSSSSSSEQQQQQPKQAGGLFGAAAGLWRGLQDKLFDIEARILTTASATVKQTTTVKKLKEKAARGEVDQAVVAREQQRLGQMQQQLEDLEQEAAATQSTAQGLLRMLGLGGSSSKQKRAAPAAAVSSSSSTSSGGRQGASASGVKMGSGGVRTGTGSSSSGGGGERKSNALVQVGQMLGLHMV